MAQLATAATVRTNTGLRAEVSDALIGAHLPPAQERIVARIGATIYAAILAAAGGIYTATVKTAMTRAESLLAGAIVLRHFLHQAGPGGMVVSVFSGDGKESQLATAAQLSAKAAGWEQEAWLTIAPWEALNQNALVTGSSPLARPARTISAGPLTLTAVGRGLEVATDG
jgi:hypothetical protein